MFGKQCECPGARGTRAASHPPTPAIRTAGAATFARACAVRWLCAPGAALERASEAVKWCSTFSSCGVGSPGARRRFRRVGAGAWRFPAVRSARSGGWLVTPLPLLPAGRRHLRYGPRDQEQDSACGRRARGYRPRDRQQGCCVRAPGSRGQRRAPAARVLSLTHACAICQAASAAARCPCLAFSCS